MVTQAQIDRINELSRKSKTPEGLTEEEKIEQQKLRRLYIDSFKEIKYFLYNLKENIFFFTFY